MISLPPLSPTEREIWLHPDLYVEILNRAVRKLVTATSTEVFGGIVLTVDPWMPRDRVAVVGAGGQVVRIVNLGEGREEGKE
jgi:hypothetical protein